MPPHSSEDAIAGVPDGINLATVRAAIPKHCFEISTVRGMLYFFQDALLLTSILALRYYVLYPVFDGEYGSLASALVRLVWWNVLGFQMWCLFMIGHDAGHGTFSTSPLVSMIMGHIAHTPLLVPYHAWRLTHRTHHQYHNDLDRDKTWTPVTDSHFATWASTVFPGWVYRGIRFSPVNLIMFPYYLLAPGGDLSYGSHFNPFNKEIFVTGRDRLLAVVGDLCIVSFLGSIFRWAWLQPELLPALIKTVDWYFVPYIICSMWLSLVTYLHHTHPDATFYRNKEWSFTKGAGTTTDRDFGPVINYLHHNIETHFIHHLFFTKIPHYHLKEATKAALPILGEHYNIDTRNPFLAFLSDLKYCMTVPDQGEKVNFNERATYLAARKRKVA
eukprot:TRINITY_DN18942_c0_g1_i1.p1 TRINITY_DN18942_c0_g1~~TRINITY_DN18942_c0_g1_i1.p1  ORF type:complete len:387 (-),score=75.73 TRINITY_DN18942_c0_g1_i1:372-1532(-)